MAIVEQGRRDRAPDVACAPLAYVVEDDSADLAPLTHPGAVTNKEAASRAIGVVQVVPLTTVHDRLHLSGRKRGRRMGFPAQMRPCQATLACAKSRRTSRQTSEDAGQGHTVVTDEADLHLEGASWAERARS